MQPSLYFYDYEGTVSNVVSPTVGPKRHRFGPITRGEHNLQLLYSGQLHQEPQQQQEPQVIRDKSYEQYKRHYFLPEHVRINPEKEEVQHNHPRLENRTRVERQQPQHASEEGETAVQLGPRDDVDVIERRQGILGTGRILRATALAVS